MKRARELIYTAERQASRDVSLAGLRPKPGSSQKGLYKLLATNRETYTINMLYSPINFRSIVIKPYYTEKEQVRLVKEPVNKLVNVQR